MPEETQETLLDRLQSFFNINNSETDPIKTNQNLEISNVALGSLPANAGPNDPWTGQEDELGNRTYRAFDGSTYTLKLSDDQRTTLTKVQEDIIPAVKEYVKEPFLPTAAQVLDTGKAVASSVYDTASIPGDLVSGERQLSDVTMGDIYEIASGSGAMSTLGKAPPNSLRTFGGPAAVDYYNDDLSRALAMQREGASAEKIFDETGRVATMGGGKQGYGFGDQFKFEIDDSKIIIDDSMPKEYLEKYYGPDAGTYGLHAVGFYLSSLIPNHKELFAQYPRAKNVSVRFLDKNQKAPTGTTPLASTSEAHYNHRDNEIVLQTEVLNNFNTPRNRDTFFHELQHAVQAQDALKISKDWAGGGEQTIISILKDPKNSFTKFYIQNLSRDKKMLKIREELRELGVQYSKNKSDKLANKLIYKWSEFKDKTFEVYMRTGIETEARVVGARSGLIGTKSQNTLLQDLKRQEKLITRRSYYSNKPENYIENFMKRLTYQKLSPELQTQYLDEAVEFITEYQNKKTDFESLSKDEIKAISNASPQGGYAEGGSVNTMDNQMRMFEEGGIADDGMNRDPISGNEVPSGSLAKEVRDDIPAQLSEGEYVVPADVVRYFGVRVFEEMRMEAKMGLQAMERDGRIGGETTMSQPDQGTVTEEDLAQIEQMFTTGVANGGLMDKIAYAATNDPVINKSFNQGGAVVSFAVGGMAQSAYADPTQVDAVIGKFMQMAQEKPQIMEELAKRGIQVNRTSATEQPQQIQMSNSPAQTTEPITEGTPVPVKAADGILAKPTMPLPVGFQSNYAIPGASLTNAVPTITPAVAPVVEPAQPTSAGSEGVPYDRCAAAGMILDPVTNACVLRPQAGGDEEQDAFMKSMMTGASEPAAFRFKDPETNYFEFSQEDFKDFAKDSSQKDQNDKDFERKALGLGLAIAGSNPITAFGALVFSGFKGYEQGQAISELRAMALVAESKGFTAEAIALNNKAEVAIGNSSFVIQGLEKLGSFNGLNDFFQQVGAFGSDLTLDESKYKGAVLERARDAYALANGGRSSIRREKVITKVDKKLAPVTPKQTAQRAIIAQNLQSSNNKDQGLNDAEKFARDNQERIKASKSSVDTSGPARTTSRGVNISGAQQRAGTGVGSGRGGRNVAAGPMNKGGLMKRKKKK